MFVINKIIPVSIALAQSDFVSFNYNYLIPENIKIESESIFPQIIFAMQFVSGLQVEVQILHNKFRQVGILQGKLYAPSSCLHLFAVQLIQTLNCIFFLNLILKNQTIAKILDLWHPNYSLYEKVEIHGDFICLQCWQKV